MSHPATQAPRPAQPQARAAGHSLLPREARRASRWGSPGRPAPPPSHPTGWLRGLGTPASDSPGAPAAGIARLAASSPLEREAREVSYYSLPVRSLLNRVRSNRVGFLWSINPYRGCEFGCHYCYARYTHEYMELGPEEFEKKIYAKAEAARLLRRDLAAARVLGEHIAIGAATDPYQPAERRFEVTRAVLETLLEFSQRLPRQSGLAGGGAGLSLSITTKSNLVLRDLELLQELSRRASLHVNMTVTTVNPRLARALEPRAPRPDLRLDAVEKLNRAGVAAGVFLCPVLPGINDSESDLDALLGAAARAGARYLCSNVVFLMPSAQARFFPFLEEKFPRLVKQYRKWFRRSGYLPDAVRRAASRRVARLRARHGLAASWPDRQGNSSAARPDYSALARETDSAPAARSACPATCGANGGAAAPQLTLPFAS